MTDTRITTKEAARRLNLSSERVRQLANSGKLPCTRTELGRLFDPDAVTSYGQARTRYGRDADPPAQ